MGKRTLADWPHWQESLHPRAIEMGLERVRELGQRLNWFDQRNLTPTSTGNNGKRCQATFASRG